MPEFENEGRFLFSIEGITGDPKSPFLGILTFLYVTLYFCLMTVGWIFVKQWLEGGNGFRMLVDALVLVLSLQ